ncbi:MAG TPA: radical SAM protein [Candidatus Avibacteroides faecavium]|nr:radical SAM protein [Candidatus Avibacteroides faecavium]
MSTVIYPSPIFGPVHSRRLGVSLGVNLMPGDGKVCTFDCIYCECGFNKDFRPRQRRPTRDEVRAALEDKLREMRDEGRLPDVITFAGNGEPTAHPDFGAIIGDTMALRDAYCPAAKVSVLSNSTFIGRQEVFDALLRVDNNIIKLDTVDEDYIRLVNRPSCRYDLGSLVERMKQFGGQMIVQTMFMHGTFEGRRVDNVDDSYVLPWMEAVKAIRPRMVMIYTIDRETPDKELTKATHAELDRIAAMLRAEGLEVSVSY